MNTDNLAKTIRAKILVVDDDPFSLKFLGRLLEPHYEVLAAASGKEALRVAAIMPPPDLILLDILMPDMDGYAVLTGLRESSVTRDISVIFVTGMDSAEDEQRGLKLGAVDYITKPYRLPIILARVNNQLELKCARDRLTRQNANLEAEVTRRMLENQQVQLQLLQAEKLSAIGLLAAGVVHEINNPIGYVSSNLGTLEKYLADIFVAIDKYEAAGAPWLADTAVNGRAAPVQGAG